MAVTGASNFLTADHLLALKEERHNRKKIGDDANDAKLKVLVEELEETDRRLILRAKNTGSCMTIWVLR